MRITMRDPMTGQFNTLDVAITPDELAIWKAGTSIQLVVPGMSLDDREFLISGIPPGKWDEYMGESEGHLAPGDTVRGD